MIARTVSRTGPGIGPLSRGFTLVELAAVLAVLTVVLAVALPALGEFSAANQVSSLRASLSSALALARTEAARRGVPVLVVANAGGASGNRYGPGWSLVVDTDGDGAAGDSEPRLRRFPAVPEGLTLDGPASLAFGATGALADRGAEAVFAVCRVHGPRLGYTVTVAPAGSADVANADSSECP